ncbi:MAG: flagellar protein FlaG [Thiomicrospira sp.]|uniref:flagellar protein FlaG n=1 Tax=Thiomicrospira sp. TaxID=935 RepID=UPI0019E6A4F2|nr:flagellar protein FlaG [Thiomicrospira sp.]MBE0494469.1 flagellar protein FlaG [Thiomicrospira sp.]
METSGLSNNIGYRTDTSSSSQVEQKTRPAVEQVEKSKPVNQPEVTKAELLEVDVERVSDALSQYGLSVSFDRDVETNRPIVRIVDSQTDEVIKQYPTEGALQVMKNIQNYLMQQPSSGMDKQQLTGALFNEII